MFTKKQCGWWVVGGGGMALQIYVSTVCVYVYVYMCICVYVCVYVPGISRIQNTTPAPIVVRKNTKKTKTQFLHFLFSRCKRDFFISCFACLICIACSIDSEDVLLLLLLALLLTSSWATAPEAILDQRFFCTERLFCTFPFSEEEGGDDDEDEEEDEDEEAEAEAEAEAEMSGFISFFFSFSFSFGIVIASESLGFPVEGFREDNFDKDVDATDVEVCAVVVAVTE